MFLCYSIRYDLLSLLHTSLKYILACVIAISFYLVDITPSFAAAGDLDTGFGAGGVVMTAVGAGHDIGRSMAVQPDGKILLTGYLDTLGIGGADDFAAVRYNPDGSLDTSFGSNGIAITDIGEDSGSSYSIAVQADGKILLGGQTFDGMNGDFAVVRYTSDGVLDSAFDTDGIVTTNISPYDQGFAIAIQSDGKILLGGVGYTLANAHYTLVRYNQDGSLDSGFGVNGIVTTNIATDGGAPYGSIAVQPDGKILFVGSGNALVRYNSNGSIDVGFGNNGVVTIAIKAWSIAIQTDGKIVAGGYIGDGFDHDFAVARYNVNGTLDISFDSDGVRAEDFSANWDEARMVVVQPDKKILLGGNTAIGNVLVRYNSDGSLDTSFDSDGIVNTVGYAHSAAALQADGKILLGGYAFGSSDLDFQLVRYLNDDDGHLAQLTPTSFSFTDLTDVELNVLQASENININGLGDGNAVPVTVVGGEYAINAGSYTTDVGYVTNGDQVSVRHTSAATGATDVNTTLSVGGLHANNNLAVFIGAQTSDTFTSTTGGLPPQVTGIWSSGNIVIGETISMFVFGNYFDTAPGATQVYINGVQQFIVQVVTPEMLIVRMTVTPAMIGGPVTVTTSNGSADSPTNFGDPPTGVTITGVWPASASVGDFVFVFGSGYALPISVSIGATSVPLVQVVSESMLIMIVPPSAGTGLVSVTTPSGSASSSGALVITP